MFVVIIFSQNTDYQDNIYKIMGMFKTYDEAEKYRFNYQMPKDTLTETFWSVVHEVKGIKQ